jgi:hypothetical protein
LNNIVVAKLDVEYNNYKMPLTESGPSSSPEKVKVHSREPIKLSNNMEYDVHTVSEKERRMLQRINKYK